MIVGREEGTRSVDMNEVLKSGVGDGESVERRGTTSKLVKKDLWKWEESALQGNEEEGPAHQRLLGGAGQNAGGLVHFDHESATIPVQLISSSHTGEDAVDDAHFDRIGGHEGAGLSEDGDKGGLTKEGRLAGHVLLSKESVVAHQTVR